MGYTTDHLRRIERLEDELLGRPQKGDVEHVRERLKRRDAMYEAAIARNTILKRRLEEANKRLRELERGKAAA